MVTSRPTESSQNLTRHIRNFIFNDIKPWNKKYTQRRYLKRSMEQKINTKGSKRNRSEGISLGLQINVKLGTVFRGGTTHRLWAGCQENFEFSP